MKIGLNATCFNNRPSGAKQRFIGIYSKLFPRMKNDSFIVYEPVDCSISDWFDHYDNVTYVKTPLHSERRYQKYIRGLFYWPKIYKAEQFDIFETFNLPLIRGRAESALLTIHDIRGVHLQDSWTKRVFHNMILSSSLKRADHIVTVSNYMKNEILNHFPNTKVSVIYNGIDESEFYDATESEKELVISKFKLPHEFILTVGHFEPRKNYHTLLQALKILHSKGDLVDLLIVGNDSGKLNSVLKMSESLGIANHVKVLSGITNQELRVIYRLAKLFVFPSSYEGFGIPILEAMASECPLILSDIPVFREIAGDQCGYFNYSDPSSIADKVGELIHNIDGKSEKLVKYGTRRVQNFSFDKVSQDLKQQYKDVIV
jgi:glycosyltransferase involved in cell wall biosynthesis